MATLSELEAKYFVDGAGDPHSGDTQVILHVDGASYFSAMFDAIAATSSQEDVIYITAWVFSDTLVLKPPISLPLGRLLHDKASSGVDVRLIAWTGRFSIGLGGVDTDSWWHSPARWNAAAGAFRKGAVFVVNNNITKILQLRKLNHTGTPEPPLRARLMMDHSSDKWGSRHQKYAVVYKKATNSLHAFVGGLNLFDDRVDEPQHANNVWHDTGVELRGGAAASVWADFRTRWEEARTLPSRIFRAVTGIEIFNNPAVLNLPPVPAPRQHAVSSTSSVRILRSYGEVKESPPLGDDLPWTTLPAQGIREVLPVYQNAIDKAQRYIYIEDQYLNTPELLIEHDLLFPRLAGAANRGVKVILVIPGRGDPNDPFIKFDDQSSSFITSLRVLIDLFRQVNLVMYRVHDIFVHSKIMMIDDEFVAVGSANFADRSMEGRDTELQAAIVDPGTLVSDLRVRLWADHLRVDPANPAVAAELQDLSKSLGIFRIQWITGSGVTFPHPNSRLQRVGP